MKESILKSTKSGLNAIFETIYNKLLNGERLSTQELKWTNTNVGVFKVDKKQLRNLIGKLNYNDISLNWLDVSNVIDMNNMFANSQFNGDISKWDVSKVKNMSYMFYNSTFNGDISKWDVSNVKDMCGMFYNSTFNGDISEWNVSNVEDMREVFAYSEFNSDISKWNISKDTNTINMFKNCKIKEEYKPTFYENIIRKHIRKYEIW